jgi:hypothetical protein
MHRHLDGRLVGFPVEVGVVKQRRQLVYSFSDTLFGTKLPEESDHLAQHKKSIPVARVVPALSQGTTDPGKNLLRGPAENELEGRRTHAEI